MYFGVLNVVDRTWNQLPQFYHFQRSPMILSPLLYLKSRVNQTKVNRFTLIQN